MRTHQWMPAAQATLASKRADCGHPSPGAKVYLRTEKAGGQTEVYTVCAVCTGSNDYTWMPGSGRPRRVKVEEL